MKDLPAVPADQEAAARAASPVREGRPSYIDQETTLFDGTRVVVGDHFLERLASGLPQVDACAQAGISQDTVRSWKLRGARHRLALSKGNEVSPEDMLYVRFLDRVEMAQAQFHDTLLQGVVAAATTRQIIHKSIVKRERRKIGDTDEYEMVEVERTDTTEDRPAAYAPGLALLERRYPHLYMRRFDLGSQDPADESSEADRMDALAESLQAYAQGVEDGASTAVMDVAVVDE